MSQRACQWILVPSLDEESERVCGDPIDGESRYCAAHREEMDTCLRDSQDPSQCPS